LSIVRRKKKEREKKEGNKSKSGREGSFYCVSLLELTPVAQKRRKRKDVRKREREEGGKKKGKITRECSTCNLKFFIFLPPVDGTLWPTSQREKERKRGGEKKEHSRGGRRERPWGCPIPLAGFPAMELKERRKEGGKEGKKFLGRGEKEKGTRPGLRHVSAPGQIQLIFF